MIEKVERLEHRIVKVDNNLNNSFGFQLVREGSKVVESVREGGVLTRDRLQVLKDEVEDDPSIALVGDNLIT